MGKQSKRKWEKREKGVETEESKKFPSASFLSELIRYGIYFILLTPLIVSDDFYYPFMAPKSLFFMGGCQIIFFIWLFLILEYRQYRPKTNSILLVLIFFLIVLTLSSVFGADLSRSFWSDYGRMTGLLMWFHLLAFFLVISSIFKKESDWKKIFTVSVSVSILAVFITLLAKAGLLGAKFAEGALLGNSSFLGTYFLFNAFFALYLFFDKLENSKNYEGTGKKLSNWGKYFGIAVFLLVLTVYLIGARAALIAALWGFGFLFLLWSTLRPKSKNIRIFGKIFFFIFIISSLAVSFLVYLSESFVQQKFIELAGKTRLLNWQIAWKGFLEKPWLGWGLENYEMVFYKFFNPCFFTPEYGGEARFDKAHNIIFDNLATSGVLGTLGYFGLFGTLFYTLSKKFLKDKVINFWAFSVFLSLPLAYFIQNLTVFDVPPTLMMFFLVLGFVAFLANKKEEAIEPERKTIPNYQWFALFFCFIFFAVFFRFTIQPLRANISVTNSLRVANSQQRIEAYQKALQASPLGKYQLREFFAVQSQEFIQKNIKEIPPENIEQELNFVLGELEKTPKESPYDLTSLLVLADVSNFYAQINPSKVWLAEKYAEKAIKVSPTHQRGYIALAQAKAIRKDFKTSLSLLNKAIELEPKWFPPYQMAARIAFISGDMEMAQSIIKKAIETNPDWKTQAEKILEEKPKE